MPQNSALLDGQIQVSDHRMADGFKLQPGLLPIAGGAGGRIAFGQFTTVSATDTIVTGLTQVTLAVAVLDSDPTDDPMFVTATIGNQSGAPAAGSIIIKSWQNTGGTDPTPTAGATFSKKVNWIAIGT